MFLTQAEDSWFKQNIIAPAQAKCDVAEQSRQDSLPETLTCETQRENIWPGWLQGHQWTPVQMSVYAIEELGRELEKALWLHGSSAVVVCLR